VSFEYQLLSTASKSVPDIMLTVSGQKVAVGVQLVGVLPFLQNQLAQNSSHQSNKTTTTAYYHHTSYNGQSSP